MGMSVNITKRSSLFTVTQNWPTFLFIFLPKLMGSNFDSSLHNFSMYDEYLTNLAFVHRGFLGDMAWTKVPLRTEGRTVRMGEQYMHSTE